MSLPVLELVGALPPGSRLHEYALERVLGHGGFGITYLARDTHLDKLVAIKEYLPNDLAARLPDASVRVRSNDTLDAFRWGLSQFVKEARVLARFSHPSLIQIHRYFEANGTAYFVMDYAEGVTLASVLKDKTTIPEMQLRDIIFPILAGLEEVHRLGVLHRDIKPENIILRHEGSMPVLIDFGAARQSLGSLTKSMLSVATAGYAPLEQYGADMPQGPWTDLYAMGAVAYRAICGRRPSDAVNRLRTDPVVQAVFVGKDRYTANFLSAVDWALAVNAEDRPQTIAEWGRALDGTLTPPPMIAKSEKFATPAAYAIEPTQIIEKTALAERSRTGLVSGTAVPSKTSAAAAVKTIPSTAQRAQHLLPDFLKSGSNTRRLLIAGTLIGGLALLILTILFTANRRGRPLSEATAEVPSTEFLVAVPPPATDTVQPAKPLPDSQSPAATPRVILRDTSAQAAKPKNTPVAKVAPLATFKDCADCPMMVALPLGIYSMGAAPGAAATWEGPAHDVSLTKPFAIGKFEITAAEWQACAHAGDCRTMQAGAASGAAALLPAVGMSWAETQNYVGWLSRVSGRRYRLASEAEWEYAVRARTHTARYWGESRSGQCEYANGADVSAVKLDSTLRIGEQPCDDGHAALAAVGQFKPNAFGLHDLAGNAWEWTQDCWANSYRDAPTDGSARELPNCAKRVIRGGSWRTKPESLRSSNRGFSPVNLRSDDLGFRVVAE